MTHSLESLLAMPNAELDRLAAEKIMGWQWKRCCLEHPLAWFSKDGVQQETGQYSPTTDRNQSSKLQSRIAERAFAQHVLIGFTSHRGYRQEPAVYLHVAGREQQSVPSSIARSETIAALLAYFAIEEPPQ